MWNQRYSAAEYIFGTEPNDFLKEMFQKIPSGGHVLCLAEGEGRNAVFLAEQGYEVTAIDLSEVGLKKAVKLADEREVHITTQIADLAEYAFGNAQWDGIVSISAHLPDAIREHVHARIIPALKHGGVFILEAYTYEQTKMEGIGGPDASQKDRFMSLEKLRAELAELHEVIGIEKQRIMSEGKRHKGLSAVVQFIGYKD